MILRFSSNKKAAEMLEFKQFRCPKGYRALEDSNLNFFQKCSKIKASRLLISLWNKNGTVLHPRYLKIFQKIAFKFYHNISLVQTFLVKLYFYPQKDCSLSQGHTPPIDLRPRRSCTAGGANSSVLCSSSFPLPLASPLHTPSQPLCQ